MARPQYDPNTHMSPEWRFVFGERPKRGIMGDIRHVSEEMDEDLIRNMGCYARMRI
jgi:hypothetical protein